VKLGYVNVLFSQERVALKHLSHFLGSSQHKRDGKTKVSFHCGFDFLRYSGGISPGLKDDISALNVGPHWPEAQACK